MSKGKRKQRTIFVTLQHLEAQYSIEDCSILISIKFKRVYQSLTNVICYF